MSAWFAVFYGLPKASEHGGDFFGIGYQGVESLLGDEIEFLGDVELGSEFTV